MWCSDCQGRLISERAHSHLGCVVIPGYVITFDAVAVGEKVLERRPVAVEKPLIRRVERVGREYLLWKKIQVVATEFLKGTQG